jgi:methyl-accepting chemotaxis protein
MKRPAFEELGMIHRLTIAARLWAAIAVFAFVLMGLFGTVAWRSAKLTHDNQVAETRLNHIIGLSARWAGLTETNVQRVVASVVGSDAAVSQHFAPEIKATTAQITGLQKEIEELAVSDEERAQLAKVAQARKAYIDAREVAVAQRTKGDADAAQQQLRSAVLPAVTTYLTEQRAYVDLQQKRAEQQRGVFAQARTQSMVFAGSVMALLLVGMVVGGVLLVRSIVRPLREAGEISRRIGEGDLTAHVDTGRHDEIGQLMKSVAGMRDALRQVVSQVRASTDSIQVASSEVAQGNVDLSQRTEQAAASLQQTASAMEELTSTVRQTADSARTASQLAASASAVADRGGAVVSQVVSTMDEINTSSRKIADITSVIDGIAFQTNILALNAAVEAARAGEQGRGFAVVAGEVRSLAQRSAEAAREIKALIGSSVERVESGARLVGEAGTTMTEIVGSVQRVTDIIGEISAATTEQSNGIGSVNTAVAQLDQATQQNAALVEESAAAAGSLREQAGQLAQLVAGFNVGHEAAAAPARVAAQVIGTVQRNTVGTTTVATARPAPARKPAARPAAAPAAAVAVAAPVAAVPADRVRAPAPAPAAKTADAEADWETF